MVVTVVRPFTAPVLCAERMCMHVEYLRPMAEQEEGWYDNGHICSSAPIIAFLVYVSLISGASNVLVWSLSLLVSDANLPCQHAHSIAHNRNRQVPL